MAGATPPGYTDGGRLWPPPLAAIVLAVHMPGPTADYDGALNPAARKAAQLDFVLDSLWNLPANSGVRTYIAAQGMTDILDLLANDDDQIEALKYQATTGTGKNRWSDFANHEYAHIKILRNYLQVFKLNTGMLPGDVVDPYRINPTDYDWFRTSHYIQENGNVNRGYYYASFGVQASGVPVPTMVPPVGGAPGAPAVRLHDPVINFKRAIKISKDDYIPLNDTQMWDSTEMSWGSTAAVHGTANVLNPTYVPPDADATLLFSAHNAWMFSVMEQKFQTDYGKFSVRQHIATRDGQAVWRDVRNNARASTTGRVTTEVILKHLTSCRYGSKEWTASATSFLLNWMDKLRTYHTMNPGGAHAINDTMKLIMLQNAVCDIPEFAAVKNSSDQAVAQGGAAFTYEQYTTLLLSVCGTYDKKHHPVASTAKVPSFQDSAPTRRVNMTMMETLLENYDYDDVPDTTLDLQVYNIDTMPYDLRVNQANRRAPGTSLAWTQWSKLNPEDQKKWDSLSDDAKRVILKTLKEKIEHITGKTLTPKPGFQRKRFDKTKRGVNLMELLEELDIEVEEVVEDEDTTTDIVVTNCEIERLVNVAAGAPSQEIAANKKKAHPGDIRRVLSSSAPGTGKRAVNMAEQEYHISNYQSNAYKGSLIDRGANGGVAGDDVRIISKTDRCVDITGIDNHKISRIPIVTVGGVVKTHKGFVIVICPEYAGLCTGKTIHSSGQLEAFKNTVDERSRKIGGQQLIRTVDGFNIPLDIKNGLAYLDIRPFTDREFLELPHVYLTGDMPWDPTVLDNDAIDDRKWYDAQQDLQDIKNDDEDSPFDSNGDLIFENPLLARLELRKSLAANRHETERELIPEEEWVDSDDEFDDDSSQGVPPLMPRDTPSSDDDSSDDESSERLPPLARRKKPIEKKLKKNLGEEPDPIEVNAGRTTRSMAEKNQSNPEPIVAQDKTGSTHEPTVSPDGKEAMQSYQDSGRRKDCQVQRDEG